MAKVLVIDDSRMMRLYLQRCLTKAGHEVEEWVPLSAMEVVDHVKASAPDLILSDYQMPGCNGSTVARMALKAIPAVPLLVLTAFRDDEMEASLLKLGVRQVLTKPIQPEALALAVRGALAGSALAGSALAGSALAGSALAGSALAGSALTEAGEG